MELLKTNNSAIYDTSFFDEINRPAIRSARPIAALVYNLLQPKRVVDVGCGLGAWLLAFKDLGACEVRGLDGEHVDPDRLLIDRNCFEPIDLARPFVVGGQYDLAISLEVAEHLPRAAAVRFVRALTRAAPFVLFSAAIPGQDGNSHINLQWPEYWRALFEAEGFRMFDPIRPLIRDDAAIGWWYRQNIVLYAARSIEPSRFGLGDEIPRGGELEWIHVSAARHNRPLRQAVRRFPGTMWAWSKVKPWIR
jgi:SAM-dependent methyltransferase